MESKIHIWDIYPITLPVLGITASLFDNNNNTEHKGRTFTISNIRHNIQNTFIEHTVVEK